MIIPYCHRFRCFLYVLDLKSRINTLFWITPGLVKQIKYAGCWEMQILKICDIKNVVDIHRLTLSGKAGESKGSKGGSYLMPDIGFGEFLKLLGVGL